jgi:organic radical activating enzyme
MNPYKSDSFCIMPWVHIYALSNGDVMPCCNTLPGHVVGNANIDSLEHIWNDSPMKDVRRRMLAGEHVAGCSKCHEKESAGFKSLRNDMNERFAVHSTLAEQTHEDGHMPGMQLRYWDIRFSNLCNMRCRTCGPTYSSNWYDDSRKLAEMDSPMTNTWLTDRRVSFVGRHDNDMWEQLQDQINNIEHIYFAGGEPLIMEDHYRVLAELIRLGKTDVRLVYNTNLSELTYKKTNVLDMWKHFSDVSVGASLDAMDARAEYIRKGTDWQQVEHNRRDMMDRCPHVNFYISPALSILNAWHLPDFHRNWVERGLIAAKDVEIALVQRPVSYRLDVLPAALKDEIKDRYRSHMDWLRDHNNTQHVIDSLEAAVKFMTADDKSYLLDEFRIRTKNLDDVRKEYIIEVLPELAAIF